MITESKSFVSYDLQDILILEKNFKNCILNNRCNCKDQWLIVNPLKNSHFAWNCSVGSGKQLVKSFLQGFLYILIRFQKIWFYFQIKRGRQRFISAQVNTWCIMLFLKQHSDFFSGRKKLGGKMQSYLAKESLKSMYCLFLHVAPLSD